MVYSVSSVVKFPLYFACYGECLFSAIALISLPIELTVEQNFAIIPFV